MKPNVCSQVLTEMRVGWGTEFAAVAMMKRALLSCVLEPSAMSTGSDRGCNASTTSVARHLSVQCMVIRRREGGGPSILPFYRTA